MCLKVAKWFLYHAGVSQQTFPGDGGTVTKGQIETFFALTTGTAVGFDTPPGTLGNLQKLTNATVTTTP
jgi:hypothetical protein